LFTPECMFYGCRTRSGAGSNQAAA
jgi:hypothetical protein